MTQPKADADPVEMCAEMMGATEGKDAPCPMASMCRGMMESKAGIGLLALVPGIVLVLVGALVLIEPRVLIWLLGGTSIVLGIFALALAIYLRRWAAAAGSKSSG